MAKLRAVTGAWVRLRRDIRTRGGVRFREGVRMKVIGHHGSLMLRVWVRCRPRYLELRKTDEGCYLEVIQAAPPKDEKCTSR